MDNDTPVWKIVAGITAVMMAFGTIVWSLNRAWDDHVDNSEIDEWDYRAIASEVKDDADARELLREAIADGKITVAERRAWDEQRARLRIKRTLDGVKQTLNETRE
jgi:hypothetical protein